MFTSCRQGITSCDFTTNTAYKFISVYAHDEKGSKCVLVTGLISWLEKSKQRPGMKRPYPLHGNIINLSRFAYIQANSL